MERISKLWIALCVAVLVISFILTSAAHAQAANKKSNIIMLMTDDTGWSEVTLTHKTCTGYKVEFPPFFM